MDEINIAIGMFVLMVISVSSCRDGPSSTCILLADKSRLRLSFPKPVRGSMSASVRVDAIHLFAYLSF